MKLGKFNIQPEVKLNASFISQGLYRVIRNPMYSGLILFFAFGILNSFQLVNFSVFPVLIIILLFKIRLEERFLEIYFGETYLNYKTRTYRLIPYMF
ncbi:MAG: isoprenylcysteine carboxylmethyltransferase family protein [Flavobacteriales bacterium]|nr:isoprenylcysteine carboxylmethyltransferase family protein [Flavobacteriales bacterium]